MYILSIVNSVSCMGNLLESLLGFSESGVGVTALLPVVVVVVGVGLRAAPVVALLVAEGLLVVLVSSFAETSFALAGLQTTRDTTPSVFFNKDAA